MDKRLKRGMARKRVKITVLRAQGLQTEFLQTSQEICLGAQMLQHIWY